MRFLFCLILCMYLGTLEGAPPVTIQDGAIHSAEDFAGDWIGYWHRGARLAGKTDTVFRLTPEGEWFIVIDGESKTAGTFRLADKHLLLKHDVKKLPSEEDPELMAQLLDRNGFLIRTPAQPEIAVVYRRKSVIPPVTEAEVRGEWRLFEESPGWKKRRTADFGFSFDGRGNYSVIKYDPDRPVPKGAENGTYILKDDEVILSNQCTEKGSPWIGLRFFKVFDELILDTPASIIYAEKQ